MSRAIRWFRVGFRVLALAFIVVSCRSAWAAKNVIIMVADGSGCNTWLATSMYQGKVGKQIYDGPDWRRYPATTYPLTTASSPTLKNEQVPSLIYDPAKYWDGTPVAGKSASDKPTFAGYAWAKGANTDSAAAASALATGIKTYKSAINWTDDNKSLAGRTIAELAKAQGKAVGVITTVEWSHATPACLGGAHHSGRNAYLELGSEMLNAPWLDVIMGAGHPHFDDDGKPSTAKPSDSQWAYVGGQKNWELLTAGKHPAGWKFIETKADFEALAQDPNPPKKVLGNAQAATTLQCNRTQPKTDAKTSANATPVKALEPFETPQNQNVPSLPTMTKGAIRCMEGNPNGFYLMIEGGAVDWANHHNEPAHMIEEQSDFVASVEAVAQWVESHGGWSETLLILTADHETGMIWGPQSDTVPFQPLADNGPGKLPGMRYNTTGHTNSLVPAYACGAGSQRFADLVRGADATAAKVWSVSGQYVDNTDIFTVMKDAVMAPAK